MQELLVEIDIEEELKKIKSGGGVLQKVNNEKLRLLQALQKTGINLG